MSNLISQISSKYNIMYENKDMNIYTNKRNFRVIELQNKKVSIGEVTISYKASPSDAAKKLLKSIAYEKGLKGNKKGSMDQVKYSIQEFTRGSKNKVFGPYLGHYYKYNEEELKRAISANGKIRYTMKAIVKLA
jgi:hypothetical protein